MRALLVALLSITAAACGVAYASRTPEQWTVDLTTLRAWQPGDGGSFFGTSGPWRHPQDAHDALVAWGPRAVPPLVGCLRDPRALPDQKLAVLDVLADLGPGAAAAAPDVVPCATLGTRPDGRAAAPAMDWFWITVTNHTLVRLGRQDLCVPVPDAPRPVDRQ